MFVKLLKRIGRRLVLIFGLDLGEVDWNVKFGVYSYFDG